MPTINVLNALRLIYGPKGMPFPGNPTPGEGSGIGAAFTELDTRDGTAISNGFGDIKLIGKGNRENNALTPVKEFTDELLGQYVFMPVYIDGIEMPNPIVRISGEYRVIETDILEVGTVTELAFMRPYSISIIATVVSDDGEWPDISSYVGLWKKGDLVTLKSAVTDHYLQKRDNMLITNITHLDAQGGENVEVLQIDGRSNVDFELEIL